MSAKATEPVSKDAFALSMADFGPFEDNPHIAIAVSGGPDSMALCLLADVWCRERGGHLTALSVDHGLRDGATAEAAQVAAWLYARGIAHQTLTWCGPKPNSGVQAVARRARYRLLDEWCRDHSVFHLLVAHHGDDQAETFLMRLNKGSGPDGLSGMSAVRELKHCRLLRPALGFRRAALKATLMSAGQAWLDDPSNDDERFARTQIRRKLMDDNWSVGGLTRSAARYGAVRIVMEKIANQFLARHSCLNGFGYATLEVAGLVAEDLDIGLRALGRLCMTVGGTPYPPKRDPLERLYTALIAETDVTRTLGRCGVYKVGGTIMICREARNLPLPVKLGAGMDLLWDARFSVRTGSQTPYRDGPVRLVPFGKLNAIPESLKQGVPQPARAAMPALADNGGIFAVPLGIGDQQMPETCAFQGSSVVFQPRQPLSLAAFCIADWQ
ncbi:MAG: tRNA lysidine(34) synthetase TilS [Rhodospirillaceae bacterium]|nr:tRNA lysidine(34) synthetase TilS [Rhodospirillaceae bacterium]